MARKKVSRNAPCPCGSGKKYKPCCYGKRFDYEEDDDGTIFKSIPMSQEMVALLEAQRQKFVQKYGREPGPNDRVFFDMPHPEQVEPRTRALPCPGSARGRIEVFSLFQDFFKILLLSAPGALLSTIGKLCSCNGRPLARRTPVRREGGWLAETFSLRCPL
jgi:hypothetical protein